MSEGILQVFLKSAQIYCVPPNGSSAAGSGWVADIFKSLVAPAVVAVFFTGMTSFVLERMKSRREAITGLSNALRDDLASLLTLSSEYWSSPAAKGDALREAKIMSALEAISTGLRAYQQERDVSLSDDLDGWIVTLRDQLTGGGFQTAKRPSDFSRVQSASAQITKMRYRIFEERLRKL